MVQISNETYFKPFTNSNPSGVPASCSQLLRNNHTVVNEGRHAYHYEDKVVVNMAGARQ